MALHVTREYGRPPPKLLRDLGGGLNLTYFGRWEGAVIGSRCPPGGFGLKTRPDGRPHLDCSLLEPQYRSKKPFLGYFTLFSVQNLSQRQPICTRPYRYVCWGTWKILSKHTHLTSGHPPVTLTVAPQWYTYVRENLVDMAIFTFDMYIYIAKLK